MNKVVASIVIILIAAAIGVGVWWYWFRKPKTSEAFWDIPSRTWKVERMFESGREGECGGPDFMQTPHFQGILSPRFSNVNYGANIRTQLPGYDTTGVPADPLGGDVGGSFSAANSGCATLTSGEANAASFLTPDGELKQPIVYDRYMYANRNSRLKSQGDPIRGDLPIVPASGNWFVPSVHPNVDLQAGAMNVLAGVNNETSHELANLIYHTSGGADTTIGGVDMSCTNAATQIFGASSAAGGDVTMTSFP